MRINQQIEAQYVRLVDENGTYIGEVLRDEALRRAEALQLDLVEIAFDPKQPASAPVCRIVGLKKFEYMQKKKRRESSLKQRQNRVELKELKFRPEIEQADYLVKMKKISGFLEDGHKVKVTLRFKGRELSHQELGLALLQRLETDLAEWAVVEQRPRLEGRQMIMTLGSKKKKS